MAATTWEVVKGDNIWNIAAETLTTPENPQPTLQEIVIRMEELIKLNLDQLKASPGKGDPNLIYPGMQLRLTAVPSPGEAAKTGKDQAKPDAKSDAKAEAGEAGDAKTASAEKKAGTQATDIGEPSVYDPNAPKAPPVRPGKGGSWDIGEPSVPDKNAGPMPPVRTYGLPPISIPDPNARPFRSPGPVAEDPSYMTEENAIRRAMGQMARTGKVPDGFKVVNGKLAPNSTEGMATPGYAAGASRTAPPQGRPEREQQPIYRSRNLTDERNARVANWAARRQQPGIPR